MWVGTRQLWLSEKHNVSNIDLFLETIADCIYYTHANGQIALLKLPGNADKATGLKIARIEEY